jgi:thioester reductase-like protein
MRHAQQYGLVQIPWDRVLVVLGDLGLPSFGLSSVAFDTLAKSVDVIFHCGAMVNHVLPYSFHKASNVEGTKEVRSNCPSDRINLCLLLLKKSWFIPVDNLKYFEVVKCFQVYKLASHLKWKHVHYISTLSVFEPNATSPVTEQSKLGSAVYLRGGYSQSKWVSDNIAYNAHRNGISTSIYRYRLQLSEFETTSHWQ